MSIITLYSLDNTQTILIWNEQKSVMEIIASRVPSSGGKYKVWAPAAAHWIVGHNLAEALNHYGDRIEEISQVEVLLLCPELLDTIKG